MVLKKKQFLLLIKTDNIIMMQKNIGDEKPFLAHRQNESGILGKKSFTGVFHVETKLRHQL